MATSQPPHLHVAICGAGVGGLLLALILSRSPHISVDVYEAASELKEIGAGIGMWPRTWKIAKKFGLDEHLAQKAIIPPEGIPKVAFQFRRGDLPQGHTFQTLTTPGGLISFHRPDFQSVLLDALTRNDPHRTRCRTHTGKKLTSYVDRRRTHHHNHNHHNHHNHSHNHSYNEHEGGEGGEIELHFADGSTARCDLLVGADGVKSSVRASMCAYAAEEAQAPSEASYLASCGEAVWSGMFAYRTTIDARVLESRWAGHRVLSTPHVYLGKNSQMTVYPMARGSLVNFAAFRARYERENTRLEPGAPMVCCVSKEEFKRDFEGWEEEARVLIDCLDTTSRWAVHTVRPLKSFVSSAGNVVLLGDAAHAMMPFQGSGAGQAIEDAYILGTLLTHPLTASSVPSRKRETLHRIATVYDTVRRPMAQHVASVSRDAGLLYTLNYPGLSFDGSATEGEDEDEDEVKGKEEEQERLQEVYARIRMNWEWAWDTSVEGDLERAVGMYEGRGREGV